MLDNDAKCPSPTLMNGEGLFGFGGTMRAGLTKARSFAGFDFSCVVLDFLFS